MNLNANIHPAQLTPACRNSNISPMLQFFLPIHCWGTVDICFWYMNISYSGLNPQAHVQGEEKNPGTHCLRMCGVLVLTYILLCFMLTSVYLLHNTGLCDNASMTTICIILFQAVGELHRDRLHHSFSWNGWMSMSWVHFLAVSPIECG